MFLLLEISFIFYSFISDCKLTNSKPILTLIPRLHLHF